MAKAIVTFKNKSGEVVAQVRGESQYDAQYIAGICPDYITASAPVVTVQPIRFESDNGRK